MLNLAGDGAQFARSRCSISGGILNLGERVRKRRRDMKLTQAQLAERMDVSHSLVGHMERGTRAISLETFVTLCNVLEVSPSYLLQGSLINYIDHMAACFPDNSKQKLVELLHLALEAGEE